jgi:hypothetical protein
MLADHFDLFGMGGLDHMAIMWPLNDFSQPRTGTALRL